MLKFRPILLLLVSILPLNFLRSFAYKVFFGYEIEESSIGFGTKIDCKEVIFKRARIGSKNIVKCQSISLVDSSIGNNNQFMGLELINLEHASIANNNSFSGLMSLIMSGRADSRSNIGNLNKFFVGAKTPKCGSLKLQPGAKITSQHLFDVVCDIAIGRKSVVAGRESQFWTHGGKNRNPIEIGEICYIGSASRFAPGAKIGNNILVGMGSVVTKHLECDNAMVAGVPAKIIKSNYNFRSKNYLEENEIEH